MPLPIDMAAARRKLAQLTGKVKYGKQILILQRRGRPTAAKAQSRDASPLSARLLKRQRALVTRAQRLREQKGDPVDRLATLLADLPPDEDDFWMEVEEVR